MEMNKALKKSYNKVQEALHELDFANPSVSIQIIEGLLTSAEEKLLQEIIAKEE